MEKIEIFNKLKNFENILKENLKEKEKIIQQIKANQKKGSEIEGLFTKMILSQILNEMLKEKIIIEGINSKGKTQFKKIFFGSKPAPDFIIRDIKILGEVKYGALKMRDLGTAVGQTMMYLESSKNESVNFKYGWIIFFNILIDLTLQREEVDFIKYLWENENIFLTII